MPRLEFWPDYDGVFWENGKSVALDFLGLSDDLVIRTQAWAAKFDDLKLPINTQGDIPAVGNAGDPMWLRSGAALLSELRSALAPGFEIFVTEEWWSEMPSK